VCPRYLLLACLAASGCTVSTFHEQRIAVEPRDDTPPEVTVAVGDQHVRGPRDPVNLVATGYDPDSAISKVRIAISVSYRCQASIAGQPVIWPVRSNWIIDNGTPKAARAYTEASTRVVAGVTMAGLWQRGRCGGGPDGNADPTRMSKRTITEVTGTYKAVAWNNSGAPASRKAVATGNFAIEGEEAVRVPR
jgi:hypothetical protein